jgi:hypothetical protein
LARRTDTIRITSPCQVKATWRMSPSGYRQINLSRAKRRSKT